MGLKYVIVFCLLTLIFVIQTIIGEYVSSIITLILLVLFVIYLIINSEV